MLPNDLREPDLFREDENVEKCARLVPKTDFVAFRDQHTLEHFIFVKTAKISSVNRRHLFR